MSPKAGSELKQISGNELKLVVPQVGQEPSDFIGLDFDHFFLQPMDCDAREQNTQFAIEYCRTHPKWRLSIQTHKYLGIL